MMRCNELKTRNSIIQNRMNQMNDQHKIYLTSNRFEYSNAVMIHSGHGQLYFQRKQDEKIIYCNVFGDGT